MNLSTIGKQEWTVDNGRNFLIEIVDSVQDYLELMKEVFDFVKLKQLLTAKDGTKILLNAMHGGTSAIERTILSTSFLLLCHIYMNVIEA